LFSGPWQCEELQPSEGEGPLDGVFVKTRCIMLSDQQFMKIQAHLLRKSGEDYYRDPLQGYFEGFARLEVYNAAAISGQTCCPALLRR
jgi:hypothetical protein